MPRTPARDTYDAALDFYPPKNVPEAAYALVKMTYRIQQGRCVLDKPTPLAHDIRDESLVPRLPPGSDFWIQKTATDVVIQGSAFAPDARPVGQMSCCARVGDRAKHVKVFGERVLGWRGDGTPVIPSPQPFLEMPLTYEHAYGGTDGRVPVKLPTTMEELQRFDILDHPGLYPRNLHGKGYLVVAQKAEGAVMPNLEDPSDLLGESRLFVRDPAQWFRQPLPWCFDWTNALMFPRMALMGFVPKFPPPTDRSLPEVARNLLPPDYPKNYGTSFNPNRLLPALFYQEASIGMIFPDLKPGTPMSVEGMHPSMPTLSWTLPRPPAIQLILEGKPLTARVQLSNCVVKPSEELLTLVYSAVATTMHRVFVPGIHKVIPFSVVVDGDRPLVYEAPVPVAERLQKGN
jgi:hypothetical protein